MRLLLAVSSADAFQKILADHGAIDLMLSVATGHDGDGLKVRQEALTIAGNICDGNFENQTRFGHARTRAHTARST